MIEDRFSRRLREAKDRGVIERGECAEPDPEDMPILPRCLTLSLEEIVAEILEGDTEARDRASQFFETYSHAIELLCESYAMRRLIGLRNFGIKTDPRADKYADVGDGPVHVVTAPYLHSRFSHTRFVAAHFIAIGIRLGLPHARLIAGALGSHAHDIGHSAYCHDGDELLVANGRPPHEERGVHIVHTDLEVVAALRAADVTPEDVASVIRETGALGALQKIADTLGYVVMDAEMVGNPLDFDFSRRVSASLTGVTETEVQVSESAPLQELLVRRAELSRDVYYHPRNLIATAAFRYAMKMFVEVGILSLDIIQLKTDMDVEMYLASELNSGNCLVHPSAGSAWNIGHGIFHDLSSQWDVYEFTSREDVERRLAILPASRIPHTVLVEPYDYAKKKYVVTLPDGAKKTLVAPRELLSRENTVWHLLVWIG